MRRRLPLAACLLLAACAPELTYLEHFQLDDTLIVTVKTESSGGALGQETHFVSWSRPGGEEHPVFEGYNGDFSLDLKSDLVTIRFCDGQVDLARPLQVGPGRTDIIPLQLITYCPTEDKAEQEAQAGKRQEAK